MECTTADTLPSRAPAHESARSRTAVRPAAPPSIVTRVLAALETHPHAAAVLGAALEPDRGPAHAYLLHGPAGTGKRDAARAFAAELLSRGAPDPENARTRVQHGAHPDLTWVTPSGAHEMLRRDVDEAVVSAAAHTPFEAVHRVFVLERVDVMNDEPATQQLALKLQSRGVPPETAQAAARLSLGDGEKALALALGDGPKLRAA